MNAHVGELDISVVVPTFNRGPQLRALLESLLAQDAVGVRYEIIVVDNKSTDGTRELVAEISRSAPPGLIRYVFEPRRGVSYARNTGAERATAPIVAFLDDDGVPVREWVRQMKGAFDDHPDADCIGGRIRPQWTTPAPSWMTPAHWGPIALQDRPRAAWVDRNSASACLLSANFACRRKVFTEVGGFDPAYPRNQDREFELRLWRADKRGLYLPSIDVIVDVPAERLTKAYHRRWQATTGRYHALMRFRDTVDAAGRIVPETAIGRRFLGSPLFLYRDCLQQVREWCKAVIRRDADRRFYCEARLWYFAGFFTTRFNTDVLGRVGAGRSRPACRRLPPVGI